MLLARVPLSKLYFGIENQVWDVSCCKEEGLIGGATILLFNNKKQLRTGKQKLRLWLGKEADGAFPSSTPGKVSNSFRLDRSLVIYIYIYRF